MRFALINNKLVEAETGLHGQCPGCSQPVFAKCGDKRVHHWAHRSTKMCDEWWEPETEWHRSWKNNFPVEWQEFFLPDVKTGEKHIADIRTPEGLVIEFQHSHINRNERINREQFYKKMVWVVDGTRLKRDFPRFLKSRNDFHKGHRNGIFHVLFPEECFPSAWVKSSVPIIFDFLGTELDNRDIRNTLYCFFPTRVQRNAIVAEISRKAFTSSVINGKWLARVERFTDELKQIDKKLEEERRRARSNWLMNYQYIRRRRF